MNFSVVILSARAANLVPCVRALRQHEPDLPTERIVVVDDGARAEAEQHLPPLRWVDGARPFVYARNANLGIEAAGTDVVLLNDDARLVTPRGLTRLAEQARRQPGLGILSAGVRGVIGNPRQHVGRFPRYRQEPETLAFVCIFLTLAVYRQIGPLDERFSGYGWDDNDYCTRVLRAGLRLGIWDGCVVDHGGGLPSTFRTRPDILTLFERNRRLYRAKWDGTVQHAARPALVAAAAITAQPFAPVANGAGAGRGLLRLNLGYLEGPLEGYVNADTEPLAGVAPLDLGKPWPWGEGAAEHVRAWDILEHLPDKIHSMNELWRVLAPGGTAEVAVPTTDGPGAFQDPTHVSFWNRRSFLYYEDGSPYRERFARHYGIRARFRVLRERTDRSPDGPRLTILLQAVKS